jgi:hypothetical protein
MQPIAVKKQMQELTVKMLLNLNVIQVLKQRQLHAIQQAIAKEDAVLIQKKDYAQKIPLREYAKILTEHGQILLPAILNNAI